ncbi:MAG: spore germination protein [Clostridiales bacterium]|nr:spore germination protein [Clostridiales bacterium]MCF8022152.1 spore germination protein [Clostridiales bacterium]
MKPKPLISNDNGSSRESKDNEPIINTGNLEITGCLDEDTAFLRKAFHVPKNKDVIFREFSLGINPPVRANAVYIEGLTDKALQDDSVFQPLMLLSRLRWDTEEGELHEIVHKKLLPGNQIKVVSEYRKVIDGILSGDTAILFDGGKKALIMETKGWEHRSVEQPGIERVVRGPHEAFTETYRVNTALIRKAFHSPDLVTEMVKLGYKDRKNCGMMYLQGVVNPKLVKEAKKRLDQIKTDYIGASGLLEQFMENNTFALAPQVLTTERPDRVINHIIEGRIAIILDGSPHVLILPMTFLSILQTAEDAYLRWPYGSILRIIRALGVFLGLFLPGIYIAVTAYHHEMIPTDLLLAIAGSREQVPFPGVVEVLIMELSFELIREAGIRIPGLIGTTLGIVGALILGQAAVAAKIVSPILIVVVAVTAIGSFTIPNHNLVMSIRFVRFIYIILGATLGVWGLVLGFFIHLNHLASLKSFQVPFLSPMGGHPAGPGTDIFWRRPVWEQKGRPGFIDPLQDKVQPNVSRYGGNRNKGGKPGDDS